MRHPPPQTYSRLFRPWDTHKHDISAAPTLNIKNESCAQLTPPLRIKTERGSSSSRSSSSSSSSSGCSLKSSYEGDIHIDPVSEGASSPASSTQRLCGSFSSQQAPVALHRYPSNVCSPATAQRQLQPHIQHEHRLEQQQMQMMANMSSANEIYYAAAAAAAAAACVSVVNTAAGLNVSPPLPTSSAAAVANSFGMDRYTLGCVEQEYARIMGEEAHMKALNARKQRPKKFKCPHCDVAFSNNGQLKGHVRIHTGERPFKCDVLSCAKTFTRNEELTRHKRIHSGLRPYACSACGKKFGRRDHLKKHMKTHMPHEPQLGGSAIFVPMYPYLYGY